MDVVCLPELDVILHLIARLQWLRLSVESCSMLLQMDRAESVMKNLSHRHCSAGVQEQTVLPCARLEETPQHVLQSGKPSVTEASVPFQTVWISLNSLPVAVVVITNT